MSASPALSEDELHRAMTGGFAVGMLVNFVKHPGVSDEAMGPLLRQFIELAESRRGAYGVLEKAAKTREPLPYIVARLRALSPWREALTLVVDNR